MYDLTALLDRRAVLALDLADANADADSAYDAYCDGTGDFGDRCYWEDRARDAAHDLEAFDLGLFALILALEA